MAGNIRINSSSGGSVTLTATETASDRILTLPGTAGTLATMDSLTGSLNLPAGTTAQRPASPVAGMMRYNSTLNVVEYYNGTIWTGGYTVTYLAVGGGGAGSGYSAGGGGAGGFVTGSANITPGVKYNILVGAGGAASTGQSDGTNGYTTVIDNMATAIGGGAGNDTTGLGSPGGSGGGGGSGVAGGAGTAGQGNAGGSNYGGGGGAGSVGNNNSGIGGAGLSSSITGSSVTYAGGGGGNGSLGGTGGGNTVAAGSGAVNTGGGGGGGGAAATGGAGGSGIAVLSIPTSIYSGTYTGSPTITTSGTNTILKFTASGSYTA